MDRFKEQDLRRLSSFAFLDQENTKRYRAIIKVLSDNHQALKSLLYPEEILAELHDSVHFADYTAEMLDQDLHSLKRWGNVESQQESTKARSIQEFQKKKLRYRASTHTIQIQRFLEDLATASAEQSGSLELTLFDRFYQALERLLNMQARSEEDYHQDWNDVFHYFEKMTRNAQDYLSLLNNESIEQAIKNQSFLLYKDTFIDYLRDFVLKLQHVAGRCEHALRNYPDMRAKRLIIAVVNHRLKLPRLGQEALDETELGMHLTRRWSALQGWFCGNLDKPSEWQLVAQSTNNAIQRISQFIFQYSERRLKGRSRGEDYLHLARLFAQTTEIADSHRLAAVFFGVANPVHVYSSRADFQTKASTWDGIPEYFEIKSRQRGQHKRDKSGAVQDRTRERDAQRTRQISDQDNLQKELQELYKQATFSMSELEFVTAMQRRTLLSWISGAVKQKGGEFRIDHEYRLRILDYSRDHWITLACEDGLLRTPNFKLVIERTTIKGKL